MSKHFFEDMVMAKRASRENKEVRKEPTPEPQKIQEVREIPKIIETKKETEVKEEREVYTNPEKSKSKYMLWSVAFISVVFFVFALSFFFSKAEVSIVPKTQDVVLNENLSASKDSSLGGLSFDMMVIPDEESATVKASGEKDVAIKATGTVIIFNSYSSSAQSLDIDTRLEGSNGKMYKTQKKIVVPGQSKDGTAGQVEVGIYGSAAGADYNSAPLDFKIFGFKGTAKYAKFVVRSKTGTEITGGFAGKAPDISDADKTTAILGLKNSLQEKLLQKSTDHPSTVVLFKDAVFTNIDDSNISSVLNSDGSATLTLKGTLYGFLFDEKKLTQKITEDSIDGYDGSDVYLPNIGDLTFALSNKDNVSFDNVQNINFNLSGSSKIVWRLDVDKFTADLVGRSKNTFSQILAKYPNIESAILKLSFPWIQSIPNKAKDINVIVNYPK